MAKLQNDKIERIFDLPEDSIKFIAKEKQSIQQELPIRSKTSSLCYGKFEWMIRSLVP